MLTLIQNIEFKNHDCDFQKELLRDSKKIRTDDKVLIAADRTASFYRIDTPSYKQLLDTATTKSYKKAPNNSPNTIISDEKKSAKSLNLDNRMDALATKDLFITFKDHKPNFNNNPTFPRAD